MPPRLGGITAHAFGDQAQTGAAARLRRQLQAPPGGQAKRGRDLQHDQTKAPIAQRLFSHRQCVGLVLGLRHQQTRWVKAIKARWIELFGQPRLPDPQYIVAHLRARPQSETYG